MRSNILIKTTIITHLLIAILILSSKDAIAVDYYTPSLPGSSAYFEISIYFSMIAPSLLVEESKPENRRYRRQQKERNRAKKREEEEIKRKAQMNVPDMVVKEIIITPPIAPFQKATWKIHLEDTDNPENNVILMIYFSPDYQPVPGDNIPIGRIQEGDRVTFETSPRLNGWMLYNDAGERLTFVPVNDVQLESFSEQF